MTDLSKLLPLPGSVWGAYPLRPAGATAAPTRPLPWRPALAACRRIAQAVPAQMQAWAAMDEAARQLGLAQLRSRLRRQGLDGSGMACALGLAAWYAQRLLGQTPRPTQLLAAVVLLDNRMAEMATGEGKTLAIGLAAAVAALAGMPVHVVTANEYLAERDAALLTPLFACLGLRATALPRQGDDALKRLAYAHDIVYATAKALAFDHLRDRLACAGQGELEQAAAALVGRAGPAPLMRGLCMALLDEADSILLDEAEVPLILSRSLPQAARRAFLWQALALARQLQPGIDVTLQPLDRTALQSAAGAARLAQLAAGLGGPWQRPRYRREAVQMALAALHIYRCNEHYLVRDGQIELLDEVTGRVALGRVWSRGLHSLVALKEGLSPAPETETLAQTTFQRFFQRYWRLCGISGTLREARAELRRVYGVRVLEIALHQPSRRLDLPPRQFASAQARCDAVAERVAALQVAGRPVLIGSDSVADSLLLAAGLSRLGIAHQVLNALNDDAEAAIIATAGQAGRVTVATRMAGRGTNIELDAPARAAGGLHVLSCQDNRSRRLDRQLAGRAGRQGDPGSTETWFVRPISGHGDGRQTPTLLAWMPISIATASAARLIAARQRLTQWREEQRGAARRQSLLEQDIHWEQRLAFAGSAA